MGSLLLCAATATSSQAVEFDAFGSLKTRYENRQDFNFSDASQSFWLTRVRGGVSAKFNDNHSVVFELQDARVIGEDPNGVPRIRPDAPYQVFEDPLDIHRLFWNLNYGDYSVKIGRQKLNLGDKRLVASLEWVNTARVHDALRVTHKANGRTIDVFVSNLVAVDPEEFNSQRGDSNRHQDAGFHGIFVQDTSLSKQFNLDYWYLLRENHEGVFADKVNTYGARFWKNHKQWRWEIQGAWQNGDFYDTAQQRTLDHEAYMFHAGVKANVWQGTFGVNYSFGSGDDDPNDGKHETFDNLYPLNHPYYGLMDLVSLQNIHDIEFSFTKSDLLVSGSQFRIAWHEFELDTANDAWYNAGLAPNIGRLNAALALGNADTELSSELDITFSFSLYSTKVLLGASRWFSGDYLADTGSSGDADFFYLQLLRNF